MSVINKVLRDLDQRKATDSLPDAERGATPGVRSGTVSVPLVPAQEAGLPSVLVLLLGAVLGLVILWALGWASRWLTPAQPPLPVTVAAAAAPASVSAVASAQASGVASGIAPASRPASGVPLLAASAAVAASAANAASRPALPASPAASAPLRVLAASASGTAPASQPAAASPPPAPAVTPAATPAAAAATLAAVSADPAANPQRLQQAWRDALTQAQALWNGGNHDGAIDLLQQALDMAERAVATGRVPASPMLPSLAREQARMEMAEGRVAQAYALLVRLEPQLGQDADIWAVRANAAQRLGSHQECIDAYARALRLRPREARWLLGSAVSMAALGDTTNAAQMAERARAVGPVPKDIWVYLQQAGVKLPEN